MELDLSWAAVQEIIFCYRILKFITVFIKAHHSIPLSTSQIQFAAPQPI
jgi:hypothetical protein